jgi:hypothetical protein
MNTMGESVANRAEHCKTRNRARGACKRTQWRITQIHVLNLHKTAYQSPRETRETSANEKNYRTWGDTEGPMTVFRPVLLAVAPAFCVGLLYASIVTSRSTVSFPYARTLISCGQPSPSNIDRSSSAWSGSAACGDVDEVVTKATFVRGWVACCGLGVSPVCGLLALLPAPAASPALLCGCASSRK